MPEALVVGVVRQAIETAVIVSLPMLLAGLMAILRPPLDALVPRLVEPHELPASSALYGAARNAASLGGPALAGVLIATIGFDATYAVDSLSFLVSLAALWRMNTPPPAPDAEPPSWRGIVEGVRFARSKPVLIGTYLIDVNAMFFAMPEALFPGLTARDLEESSFYDLQRNRYAIEIVGGTQTVEPTVTNDEESAALGVPLHSPALLFERVTQSAKGEIVEFTSSIYRGDRYRIVSELGDGGRPSVPIGLAARPVDAFA